MLAYKASFIWLINSFLLHGSNLVFGPGRILDASCLSECNEDRHLLKTASPISVTGEPYCKPAIAVHLPVPFCPAESLIFGNKYCPINLIHNMK